MSYAGGALVSDRINIYIFVWIIHDTNPHFSVC